MFDGTLNPPLTFFHTQPMPCPYINKKIERRLATDISSLRGKNSHDALAKAGFRRSQHISYKPACPNCNACKPIRVCAREFLWTKRYRRILNKNKDLVKTWDEAVATEDLFQLFKRYQVSRHSGGEMGLMDYIDFRGMIEKSPIETFIVQYRLEPSSKLIGAVLIDQQKDGFSAVYSFFDTSQPNRSLGNFMVLDLIKYTKEIGMDYLYLGYWIEGSKKMSYKADFLPAEILLSNGWTKIAE